MIEILRKLRAEHDDLAKVLDVLEQEVESYRQRGRLNRDIVDAVLDYCRGYPALCHHPKEDLIYRKLRLAAESAAINTVGGGGPRAVRPGGACLPRTTSAPHEGRG
jgi:hemerythrin-like domain-containing protein